MPCSPKRPAASRRNCGRSRRSARRSVRMCKAREGAVAGHGARLAELRQQVQREDRTNIWSAMRQAGRLQNDAVSYKAQVDNLTRERSRLLAAQRAGRRASGLARPGIAGTDRGRGGVANALQRRPQALAELRRSATAYGRCATKRQQRCSDLAREAQRLGQPHRGAGRTGAQSRRTWVPARGNCSLCWNSRTRGRGGRSWASSPTSSPCAANTPR